MEKSLTALIERAAEVARTHGESSRTHQYLKDDKYSREEGKKYTVRQDGYRLTFEELSKSYFWMDCKHCYEKRERTDHLLRFSKDSRTIILAEHCLGRKQEGCCVPNYDEPATPWDVYGTGRGRTPSAQAIADLETFLTYQKT